MSGPLNGSQNLVLAYSEIGLKDVLEVGGKNASLGHLYNVLRPRGIAALDGFCTTAWAYRQFLDQGDLREQLDRLRNTIGAGPGLAKVAEAARAAILSTTLPLELRAAILKAHNCLAKRVGRQTALAVRSSATAEDLPTASFAGQHESFLNVEGSDALLDAIHRCFASLFTERAMAYRLQNGLDPLDSIMPVGVQPMVRSDSGCAGVAFTLDPDSGFKDVVVVTGSYGLGQLVVNGTVDPDEWVVFKPALERAKLPIIARRCGRKDVRMIATEAGGTELQRVSLGDQSQPCLTDWEVLQIARVACRIEASYSRKRQRPTPMDIEWAKDGQTGEIFYVQARPETVHSRKEEGQFELFRVDSANRPPLLTGQAVGVAAASGMVCHVACDEDLAKITPESIVVASATLPHWESAVRGAAAIVTDQGGRTAHAAIVSRELGLTCVMGAGNATQVLKEGQVVTVVCCDGAVGSVYEGALPIAHKLISKLEIPKTKTHVMLNIGDPSKAFRSSTFPNSGVGLARMEFIIVTAIGIHPLAAINYPTLRDEAAVRKIGKKIGQETAREFYVRSLSEGIAKIATAFFPKPVILRTSDFRSDEYARLLGGAEFERAEKNPMLGLRGASRYIDPRFSAGFALECEAIRRVRQDMGLSNLQVMIPFCRTPDEGRLVLALMAQNGLSQGVDGLQVHVMCELPSNALEADEFLAVFDGFSIGSNDLTQLTLGIDRDSAELAGEFDEREPSVKQLLAMALAAGHKAGKPVGICGQGPADFPELAKWLVDHKIDSISVNADSVVQTLFTVHEAEKKRRIPKPVSAA